MGWVAALIGAGGSLLGGALGSKGAKDAGRAQARAAEQQLALQRGIYNSQLQNQEPFRATGLGANNLLAQLYGLPYYDYSPAEGLGGGSEGTGQALSAREIRNLLKSGVPFDQISQMGTLKDFSSRGARILGHNIKKHVRPSNMNALAEQYGVELTGNKKRDRRTLTGAITAALYNPDLMPGAETSETPAGETPAGYHEGTGKGDLSVFQSSPGYQFRLGEGLKSVQNSAAARGGLGSGNSLRAVNDYAQGMASDDFYNFVNQMNNMAGRGQTAVQGQQQAGNAFGYQAGNALGNYGDARASGIAGSANMWGQAISGVADAAGQWWGNKKKPVAGANTGSGGVPKDIGSWYGWRF